MIKAPSQPESVIPADDPRRKLAVSNPDTAKTRHVSIADDTYTILVSGAETAGRYCLIDMHVPAGWRPPAASARFRGNVHVVAG
jgi:hypothetical protein